MALNRIEVERGAVSTLTLNRPEKANALNRELLTELLQAVTMLDAEPQTKVVILKGAGRGFCAGADLSMLGSKELTILQKRETLALLPELFQRLAATKNILISQVHGYALAGGFGLALACDLTVCAEDARLGMPEIKKGLMPMNIMAPVGRHVPRKKLLEWMMTGEEIDPAEAWRVGAVNQLVPAAQLAAKTRELAERIAANPAYALTFGKEAFYTVQDMEYKKTFPYLNDMLMMTVLARDCETAARAAGAGGAAGTAGTVGPAGVAGTAGAVGETTGGNDETI